MLDLTDRNILKQWVRNRRRASQTSVWTRAPLSACPFVEIDLHNASGKVARGPTRVRVVRPPERLRAEWPALRRATDLATSKIGHA